MDKLCSHQYAQGPKGKVFCAYSLPSTRNSKRCSRSLQIAPIVSMAGQTISFHHSQDRAMNCLRSSSLVSGDSQLWRFWNISWAALIVFTSVSVRCPPLAHHRAWKRGRFGDLHEGSFEVSVWVSTPAEAFSLRLISLFQCVRAVLVCPIAANVPRYLITPIPSQPMMALQFCESCFLLHSSRKRLRGR